MNAVDNPDQVMKHFGERAREHLTYRLQDGKTVGRRTLRDLIDADLSGPRAGLAAIEITNLLLADSGERAAMADRYVEGVIERYLETNEDLVQETAEEMAADDGE